MAGKRSRASGEALPGADNFKRISGIGPGVEKRLYNAGIFTYAQLAALSSKDIAALVSDLAGLSIERIEKNDWIGQAQALAKDTEDADLLTDDGADVSQGAFSEDLADDVEDLLAASRQHYATFKVELLLDAGNSVRRTHISHIQSGEEDIWAGWEASRLLDFFIRLGEVRLPKEELNTPADVTVRLDAPVLASAPAPQNPKLFEAPISPIVSLGGLLQLRDLEIQAASGAHPSSVLRHGEPFIARLMLELDTKASAAHQQLQYTATLSARSMGSGSRQVVVETQGKLDRADAIVVDGSALSLAPGLYRLEAAVVVHPAGVQPSSISSRKTFFEGSLLQVY
ncbi:MAG: hypothetical protein MI924_25735 [Chloroflexales bacterium]|nr:hypothetical protein [Chloroflexales bacterium]